MIIRQGLISSFITLLVLFFMAANSYAATITWYGHSFFRVSDNYLTLVIDPFDDSLKYYLPKKDILADGLLISKNSFDHNNASIIDANTVITDLGVYDVNNIKIKAFQVYCDDEHGTLRGTSLVFNWNSDNIEYLFLGDIGEPLPESIYKAIGKVDVIFVPVGGTYTLELEEIKKIIERTEAKIIIPMHYKTSLIKPLWISMYNIDRFEQVMTKQYPSYHINSQRIEISPDKLPKKPAIYVLDYPHSQGEVDGL